MSVDSDSGNVPLYRLRRAEANMTERNVEVVPKAFRRHADQDDPVPHRLAWNSSSQDRSERHAFEGSEARTKVGQELITARIDTGVRSVARPEWRNAAPTQSHDRGVRRIGTETEAVPREEEQREAERKRGERGLPVVKKQQRPADGATRVHDDVVEADLVRSLERRRRSDTFRRTFRELGDGNDTVIPAQHGIELGAARRHRHVAIDVEPDRAWTEGQ